MAGVTLSLPWPPSSNHAWRPAGKGKRVRSDAYLSYQDRVNEYVLIHRVPRHWTMDRLVLVILCHPPNKQLVDIDNRIKCLQDALARAGVIRDDGSIDLLMVARGNQVEGGAVDVRIENLATISAGLECGAHWFAHWSLGSNIAP